MGYADKPGIQFALTFETFDWSDGAYEYILDYVFCGDTISLDAVEHKGIKAVEIHIIQWLNGFGIARL